MNDLGPRLRLIHVLLMIVWVAVAFAVMTAAAATIFAVSSLFGCLAVGLRRVPVADLFLIMAFTFVFGWFVSDVVERSKPTVKPRAIQSAVPIPAN